jgi:hypothetical protein
VGNAEEKRQLRSSRINNIKMDLKEIGWDSTLRTMMVTMLIL